ncbi:TAXI family TRAP transporter solute-binding subunit [Undibacterium rugosum]|uniref:ABC transporter substrate-binding protein n=1 Tax=Undibacterium rugosum TaxID=2762291 RepID=A0A923I363_9BURK|nr:TAXI family TRAP transporter solute-binding subunit [Undibacterium rugosum]MBC3936929.1 ABC transporter substrate-binding protein [Undibacterium rugosum]MBR7779445.1 ABC transporter substrate-binding protein [Undibacterium rugosum]
MQKIKFTLFSLRALLLAALPFIMTAVVVCGLAYWLVDPAPPRVIDMSTGPANSAYARFAQLYAQELAKNKITLRLQTSEGSQENFDRIRSPDSQIEVGFVRSGSTDPDSAQEQGLISLGSLFYEPIWVFYHSRQELSNLSQFKGKRINLGAEGNGIGRIFRQILAANHLQEADVQIQRSPDQDAADALLRGDTDVLVLSAGSDSPLVQRLMQSSGIRLFDFVQAEAYTRRFPYLSQVTLARGMIDIGKDIPARDYHLISPTVTLVAHESLHPALIALLLQAAQKIHSRADWLSHRAEFPSDRYTEIPVSADAEKFYQHGIPVLQRYLPFWIANFIERMWFVIVALGALLLPLSKIIPPLYVWRIRSRVYRWYGQLRLVEQVMDELPASGRTQLLQQQLSRLDEIEDKVNRISIPLSYAEELYGLRSHIDFVRKRILSLMTEPPPV